MCLTVHSPKRQRSTRPCLHVMVCTNALCCVVGGGCREKGKRQRHSQQKQKGLFPKPLFPFFPFFLLFFIHTFLIAFHPSTITPLLIHTPTYFSCLTHGCIHSEPKTPMTQHPILFIVFSSRPNSLFLFFFSC